MSISLKRNLSDAYMSGMSIVRVCIACVYVATSVVPGIVSAQDSAQQRPQAPIQEAIFVSNPEDIENLPMNTQQAYYSQREISFDAEKALDTIAKLSAGIEEIMDKVDDLDKQFDSNNQRYQTTKKEILAVIRQLEQAKDSLNTSVDMIAKYQENIIESAQKIEDLRSQIEETKEYVERFTKFLYKFHHDLYDEEGVIDEVKLFLYADKNVAETLTNDYLIESMIRKLKLLMEELQQEEKKQVLIVRESNKYRSQAQKTIEQYQQQIEDLNQKRAYLLDFLELYQENHEKIEGTIQALFDTRMQAQQRVEETIQEIASKEYAANFNVVDAINRLQSLREYAPDAPTTDLDWPLYPIMDISYFFEDEEYEKEFGVPIKGIEIPTRRVPLYAPRSAVVYRISDQGGLGVKRMALLHTDGYVSIVKFYSQALVQEGDIVRRGQIIGYTGGGSPLVDGAGFIAQGPNLTFLVAKDGDLIDPLSVLDLSVIKNKQVLPKDLKIEYLKDLYALDRERYKISFIQGTTVEERFATFLDTYGIGIYADPLFWQDAAAGEGVTPHFLACIANAESSLGRNLTTANNIGNVGNNDRGDRIAFATPLQGARLIAKTLNNVHLHQYNTIAELNGMFNREGKNYATSQFNRQNNVVRCLSMIEGYHVPDNFPFRLEPTTFGRDRE